MAWYALRPEVPGGMGPRTALDTTAHPPLVTALHYEFAGWLGDDLAESFPCYIVTQRLAEALSASTLTGFVLDAVLVTLDPQFVEFFPDDAAGLPRWSWLRITGTPWLDDLWTDERGSIRASGAALALLRRFTLDHCGIDPV